MSFDSIPFRAGIGARVRRDRAVAGARTGMRRLASYPEVFGVLAVAGVLNLWNLSVNGTANAYYAAAVKAMASSWHDFLWGSMDRSGLMTVDKPPLSDWIQALSVRVFGFSAWSLLVPSAVMGIVATGLMYDLVRRRFGRVAGFVSGIVLATTPTIVAVSRHNNPDELLAMVSVAAIWFALRAAETGRTKWIVWSGVFVGLGFETKMGVALMLVPAITVMWVWTRWNADVVSADAHRGAVAAGAFRRAARALRSNVRMVRQLIYGGVALAVVGLAWPVLVWLTPAADRPWISGTSDNSIWSLIIGYNGVGRVAGQTGAPTAGGFGGRSGGGGAMFGGATGVFRLIGSSLGSQSGWLLGFAVVSLVALIVLTRLRRDDPRTGFLIAIGGTLLVVGVVFSFASGIFHPYYVSMVAPWAAAAIGAGIGEMLPKPYGNATSQWALRLIGPLAIVGAAITELVVIGDSVGVPSWAEPLVIVAAVVGAVGLALALNPKLRMVIVALAFAGLLAAPATYAADTLGHATSGTFPEGGPSSALSGGFGGPGGFGGRGGFPARGGFVGPGRGGGAPGGGGFAAGAPGSSSGSSTTGSPASPGGAVGQLFRSGGPSSAGFPSSGGFPRAGGFGGGAGGFGGGSQSLDTAAAWVQKHGGGTIAVDSQSDAASAILAGYDNVAGIGGFSGNESTVTVAWIAQMVKEGRLRYILGGDDSSSSPSDGRQGSRAAIATAEKVGKKITVTSDGQTIVLYDLRGEEAALLAAAKA